MDQGMQEKINFQIQNIIQNTQASVIPGRYAMLKLTRMPEKEVECFFISNDGNEITMIIEERKMNKTLIYDDIQKGFSLISLSVSAPFYAVGFLATVTTSIAQAGFNVLVISTFSKDFLLVRKNVIEKVVKILLELGFSFTSD
jgi:hypothetical protein